MIDLTMHEEQLKHAIDRAKERNILIPTFAQMQNPQLVPEKVKKALLETALTVLSLGTELPMPKIQNTNGKKSQV